MDQTVLYREIVRVASPGHVVDPPSDPPSDQISVQASAIATSLVGLQQHLTELRPAYLSTTAPQKLSEREKDEIDYDVQRILQTEHKKLKALERASLAEEHATTPKRWIFSDPVREGMRQTRYNHHKGMFVALSTRLKLCSEQFQAIQKVRLSRRLKRGKVPKVQRSVPQPQEDQYEPTTTSDPTPSAPLDLPPELQQTLVLENDQVHRDLSEMLDKTYLVEKSMTEVAQLQSELSTHLTAQTEQIEHLTDEAFVTSGEVDGANLQLKKAQQRNKRASKVIVYSSVGIGCLLFIYDWLL